MADERILDPCCGSRMFWFDRKNPDAIFGDIRSISTELCDGRQLRVQPDVMMDFTCIPFADESFSLVVFDPPHLENLGERSWMAAKYGVLGGDWKQMLRNGFEECFRVLKKDGVLIFKWNESRIRLKEVIALSPHPPLFGHPTSANGKTHWMTFMKPRKGVA
jgi:SAM-dependent methyltransferase